MTTLAERLTISIPSDLYNRLQKVKADLNISKICQTAIESRVTFEEIYKQEKNQMQALIDKLRKEKEEIETNAHETGLKEGLEDAKELTYTEFKYIETNNALSEDLTEWLQNHRMDEDTDITAYKKGWIEGVLQIWSDVKDKI